MTEEEAIILVRALGEDFGYGNMIMRLKDAWSKKLQRKYGMSEYVADGGAWHRCAWCRVDFRTGEKVEPPGD